MKKILHRPLKIAASGAPKRFLEEVALPYEGDDCLIWPFYRNKKGYAGINWNGSNRSAYRVICRETHGEAPSPQHQAAHSCGNGFGGCVNPRHIQWKTPLENAQDKFVHGTQVMGVTHPRAKLTETQVLEIRELRHLTRREVAKVYGVSPSRISDICNGVAWKCL